MDVQRVEGARRWTGCRFEFLVNRVLRARAVSAAFSFSLTFSLFFSLFPGSPSRGKCTCFHADFPRIEWQSAKSAGFILYGRRNVSMEMKGKYVYPSRGKRRAESKTRPPDDEPPPTDRSRDRISAIIHSPPPRFSSLTPARAMRFTRASRSTELHARRENAYLILPRYPCEHHPELSFVSSKLSIR